MSEDAGLEQEMERRQFPADAAAQERIREAEVRLRVLHELRDRAQAIATQTHSCCWSDFLLKAWQQEERLARLTLLAEKREGEGP